jgi:hypothetical protein
MSEVVKIASECIYVQGNMKNRNGVVREQIGLLNSNTLPVWNAYIEMHALSTLHYFTHHNIYPEVPKGYILQNKGLATLFQHANDDAIIGMYKGCKHVPSPPGQPRE